MMSDEIQRVALLGLGIIGSRVADRLAASGVYLSTWSRTRRGRPDEAENPADAVREAQSILLYLKDAPAVREVMASVAPEIRADHVVVNHSTVDLETTRWLADFCGKHGCGFLDAPFTGSKLAASDGALVYYVGGDPLLQSRLDPLFAITSHTRIRFEEIGHATVIKLATNLMSACAVQSMAEALALVSHHGVKGQDLVDAVAVNANASALAAVKMRAILAHDFEPHFSLANMTKDARYAMELAGEMGLPAITAVRQRMEELCELGLGGADYSVLGKPYLES